MRAASTVLYHSAILSTCPVRRTKWANFSGLIACEAGASWRTGARSFIGPSCRDRASLAHYESAISAKPRHSPGWKNSIRLKPLPNASAILTIRSFAVLDRPVEHPRGSDKAGHHGAEIAQLDIGMDFEHGFDDASIGRVAHNPEGELSCPLSAAAR